MTSKERVLSTLNFTNTQDRVPRQLWSLPWANEHCSEMMEQLARDFEWDFDGPDTVLKEPPTNKGRCLYGWGICRRMGLCIYQYSPWCNWRSKETDRGR